MDGLALLCNLFADGPVTLRRLRAARVASLNELERATPEKLAEWLHASVPQARAFIEEARKLLRRLADDAPLPLAGPASHVLRPFQSPRGLATPEAADASAGTHTLPLAPGLFPGLDEGICARLFLHHVRTVQALSEGAGLALARRTGIPYSTLLDLSRHARRLLTGQTRARTTAAAPARSEGELAPFVLYPRRAPPERELARTDEFTLPVGEPESAGPFG